MLNGEVFPLSTIVVPLRLVFLFKANILKGGQFEF